MNRTEFIGTNLYYSQEFVDDMIKNYNQKIERLNNIIEEKKIPEKLEDIIKDGCIEAPNNFILMDKINEIIDYLKSKGE